MQEWKTIQLWFLSRKQNDAVIFVKNLMNHEETKDFYEEAAKDIGEELKVGQRVYEREVYIKERQL